MPKGIYDRYKIKGNGRRRIRYKPILEIDQLDEFNMQTFKALSIKLSRDYLGLFRSLSKLYGQSKQKKDINIVINKIEQTIMLLNSIIVSGVVTKKDSEIIVSQIEEINDSRDYYLEQSQNVAALRERFDKIASSTGVSLQDLNIAEQMVKRGASQARKQVRRRTFRGLMPRTRGFGKELFRGIGAAAFGPFAPLAGIAGGMMKDVFGLAGRIGQRVRERREARLGEQLRPISYGLPSERFERIAAKRRTYPGVEAFPGFMSGRKVTRRSKRERAAPMLHFFDKGAFRARWTKQLLKGIKQLGKGRTGLFGGLAKLLPWIAGLGVALLPLIGKAGLIIGLATAVTWATLKIKDLVGLTGEYFDVLKKVKEFQEKQRKVMEDQYAEDWKRFRAAKTPKEQGAIKRALRVRREAAQKRLYEKATRGFWNKGLSGAIIEYFVPPPVETPLPSLKPSIIPRQEIGVLPSTWKEDLQLPSSRRGSDISIEAMREIGVNIEKLHNSMDNLSDSIQRGREPISIPGTRLGDPNDSADSVTNEFSLGSLTLGER